MQTIEERLDQLEKRNRRLTAALAVMAVTICAVVTTAATSEKDGDFDTLTAKMIMTEDLVVVDALTAKMIITEDLVVVDADKNVLIGMGDNKGRGLIAVKANGVKNPLIWLSVNADGGFAQFNNKSGGAVAKIYAEANGSGVIGAFDGKGRRLQPGP